MRHRNFWFVVSRWIIISLYCIIDSLLSFDLPLFAFVSLLHVKDIVKLCGQQHLKFRPSSVEECRIFGIHSLPKKYYISLLLFRIVIMRMFNASHIYDTSYCLSNVKYILWNFLYIKLILECSKLNCQLSLKSKTKKRYLITFSNVPIFPIILVFRALKE